jgi:hypothetical protein
LIFFNLLNLFWHTDKNCCFYVEVNFWDFVRNDNSNKGTTAQDSALKKVVPNISRPKKPRHFLMHWMRVKLPDNFQMREHSWPCRFHIILIQSRKSFRRYNFKFKISLTLNEWNLWTFFNKWCSKFNKYIASTFLQSLSNGSKHIFGELKREIIVKSNSLQW